MVWSENMMDKSLLRWFGGKFYLFDELLPFPKHKKFVDVFGGSGVVALNHPKSNKVSIVYNDINHRLINFWKVVQKYPDSLKEICSTQGFLDSRELFEECKEIVEDEIIEAFHFFYINRHSFSGMNECFHGIDIRKQSRWHQGYFSKIDEFKKISNKIKDWNIECQDYQSLIKRFKDEPNTLIYLDPPYCIGGDAYEKMSGNKENEDYHFDIKEMCELIVDAKAKCIVSYDNLEDLQLLIDNGWNVKKIMRRQMASQTSGQLVPEYVIRNFNIESKIDDFFGGK